MPTAHTHRIDGLVARPEINGVLCTPASFITSRGRVTRAVVNTDDHGALSVPVECVLPLSAVHMAVAAFCDALSPGLYASLRTHLAGNFFSVSE